MDKMPNHRHPYPARRPGTPPCPAARSVPSRSPLTGPWALGSCGAGAGHASGRRTCVQGFEGSATTPRYRAQPLSASFSSLPPENLDEPSRCDRRPLLLPLAAIAGQAGDDPEETVSVRRLLEAQVESWNREDLDAFLDGYWRDPGVVFQSGSDRFEGFEALRDRYRRDLPGRGARAGPARLLGARGGGARPRCRPGAGALAAGDARRQEPGRSVHADPPQVPRGLADRPRPHLVLILEWLPRTEERGKEPAHAPAPRDCPARRPRAPGRDDSRRVPGVGDDPFARRLHDRGPERGRRRGDRRPPGFRVAALLHRRLAAESSIPRSSRGWSPRW